MQRLRLGIGLFTAGMKHVRVLAISRLTKCDTVKAVGEPVTVAWNAK